MASRLQISVRDYHLALRAKGQAQLPTWPRLERRHQTIRLRDRHWNPTSVASFRRRRPSPYERNAAISRHFERDPIPYALETDWPVGAAGFEPLHLEIRSAELHPASTGFRRRSGAPLIRDAQVQVPPPGLRVLANSDSNMHRFESRRPSQAVGSPTQFLLTRALTGASYAYYLAASR